MNQRQLLLMRAAQSAVAFATTLEKPSVRITEAAKRLDVAVKDVQRVGVEQIVAKNNRRAPHLSLNRAKTILLRKHLDPIAADGVEMFAGLPGIEERLRLPRIKDGPAKHLAAAERVRQVAEQHEQEFISDRNYDPDFLEQFDLAVRNLEAAASVKPEFARVKYSQATQSVEKEIARVRKALNALDSRMCEAYLDDRAMLRRWRRRSKVPPKMGRPKKRKD